MSRIEERYDWCPTCGRTIVDDNEEPQFDTTDDVPFLWLLFGFCGSVLVGVGIGALL